MEQPPLSSLRKPIAVEGIVAYYFYRPLSLIIVKKIMNSRILPNQVTLVSMILSVTSGLLISQGRYGAGIAGAVLLQMQAVLDCVDGGLARLRGQSSTLGQWLDTLSDDLGKASFMAGASWAVTGPALRWLGLAGLVSFLVAQAVIYYSLATRYRSGDLLNFQMDLADTDTPKGSIRFLFMHDFFCLFCLVMALFNSIPVALALVSLGAFAFLATLIRRVSRYGLSPIRASETL